MGLKHCMSVVYFFTFIIIPSTFFIDRVVKTYHGAEIKKFMNARKKEDRVAAMAEKEENTKAKAVYMVRIPLSHHIL